MESLEKLPKRYILARDGRRKIFVRVLVDGDYDGEWFGQLKWDVMGRKQDQGYITHSEYVPERRNYSRKYLHHFVLPAKEGFVRTFKNGNHYDCRSANIIYRTHSDIMQERSDREAAKTVHAYWDKMRKLKEENG